MADDDRSNPNEGPGPDNAPQIAVLTQYVKDLSVESPNSPAVFQWQQQPQVDVQFSINVDNVSDEVHEVVLKVNVAARSENGPHFMIDLSYAGLFGLRNLPEEAIGPFLLVEAPRLLFPFIRQIVAESVQNVGFPPLLLEPIDFGAAFMQQLNAAQGANGGDGGQPKADSPPADSPPANADDKA